MGTDTQGKTLREHVHQFTGIGTHVYTDAYESYHQIERTHSTVTHRCKEWARDDDGDGMREVHTNTTEGMWAGLRTFLRPFRGIHKRFLTGLHVRIGSASGTYVSGGIMNDTDLVRWSGNGVRL